MEKINAVITGVGGYVPDYILTNDEISKMVDTNDEWIMTRIGVRERRILNEEGLGTSYMLILTTLIWLLLLLLLQTITSLPQLLFFAINSDLKMHLLLICKRPVAASCFCWKRLLILSVREDTRKSLL